jgi:DNA repair protein RecO (recombination protein O)
MGSKRGKNKLSLFSTLILLQIELDYKEKRQIQSLRNVQIDTVYSDIPYHTHKSIIALFLAEVLSKCLREEEANAMLYDFLKTNFLGLDHLGEGYANFHLLLLAKLTRFLGFYPQNNFSTDLPFFDLFEGKFTTYNDVSPYLLSLAESELFSALLSSDILSIHLLKLNRTVRSVLLEKLIIFYQLHLDGFGELKSLAVLKEIYN